MKNIATIALTITASILLNSSPSKAEVDLFIPTEEQFIQYESLLSRFFQNEEDDAVYTRKSRGQIRRDGMIACTMFSQYTIEEYLAVRFNSINRETSSLEERKAQYTYLMYGTAASVDAMCSKHRESLLKLVQRVKEHGFNHYLLD
ncbi:MAG: hypothetical protein RLZZ29_1438 [Cyanobacteriota bacterium]